MRSYGTSSVEHLALAQEFVSTQTRGAAYLILAAIFLLIALSFGRKALWPLGGLLLAAAAATVVAFAIGMALILIAATLLGAQ